MPVASSTTIGLKSRNMASLLVAATHWFVSTPAISHGLGVHRAQLKLEVGLEEGAQPVLLDVSVLLSSAQLIEHLVAPGSDSQAAVAQEGTHRHQPAAVLGIPKPVPGPDDRNPTIPTGRHQLLDRLDAAAHVLDVDPVAGIPAVGVQEIVLGIDYDKRGAPHNEVPFDRRKGSCAHARCAMAVLAHLARASL